jgi:Ner family transcriptional regulator
MNILGRLWRLVERFRRPPASALAPFGAAFPALDAFGEFDEMMLPPGVGSDFRPIGPRGIVGEGWHRQDVVAAVKKRGSNLAKLSREHGFARTTMHAALYRRHPRAQAVIADFLGVRPRDIWPHWYGGAPCDPHKGANP